MPFIHDIVLPRNRQFTDELFALLAHKGIMAEKSQWAVGAHQVLILRVLVQLLSQIIVRERSAKQFEGKNVQICLESLCEFVRLLFAYKMEREAEDVLKKAQALLVVEEVRPLIFTSCRKTVKKSCSLLLGGKLEGP